MFGKNTRQWNEDSHTSNVINHHNPDSNPDPASSSANPPVVSSTVPSQKKGHVLRLIETGGVFCVKCGKQTKNMKHQRLKILNKPCEYSELPQNLWLTNPGKFKSIQRTLDAEKDLKTSLNQGNHQLVWNRKLGKQQNRDDYGLIWCEKCDRQWPWGRRRSNLSKTICRPLSQKPSPPPWVEILEHYSPEHSTNPSRGNIATNRLRIIGKQSSAQVFHHQSHPSHEMPSSSNTGNAASSMEHPRRGIQFGSAAAACC